MIRSRLTTGLVTLVAAVMATAAAQAQTATTLRFMTAFEANDVSAWQPVVAAYESQHPGVAIKLDAIGGSGAAVYPDVLRTSIAAGNPPDIFTNWGGEVAGPFIDAGQVAQVDQYYAKYGYANTLVPWSIEAVRRHGKLYGVPFRARGMGFWYNRDVFAKFGLKEPTTYGELAHVCSTLRQHDVACASVGGKYGWHTMRVLDYFIETSCGPDVHDALDHLTTRWDQPCVIAAYDRLSQWVRDGWILPDFLNVSPNDARMPFYVGDAAMILEGDWMESVIKADEQPVARFDFFLPPTDHTPLRYSAFAEQLMIPEHTRTADAAEAFIDWVSDPATQRQFPAAFSASATSSMHPDCNDWPRSCKWREMIGSNRSTYLPTDQEFPKELMDSFFEVQDGVVAGQMTSAAGAALMQGRAEAWRAKHPA